MSRIELFDTTEDVLVKMSEGNPGALTVLIGLATQGAEFDPKSALGGLGPILALDEAGIYGSQIWVLYKDVCGESLETLTLFLRSVQLGYTDRQTVIDAANGRSTFDPIGAVAAVRERLGYNG